MPQSGTSCQKQTLVLAWQENVRVEGRHDLQTRVSRFVRFTEWGLPELRASPTGPPPRPSCEQEAEAAEKSTEIWRIDGAEVEMRTTS